jgi:U2 small nuclear ribonucleoprotein A'
MLNPQFAFISQDLAPLASLSRLCRLDLTGNPVTKKPQYRLYLISLLPRLKLLDFSRIRDSERAEAAAAFGGADGAARAAALAADARSAAAVEEGSTLASDGKRSQAPTQNQLLAIKAAIANASTLEEVQRLEKALQSGVMPSELANGGQHAGDGGQAAMDEG